MTGRKIVLALFRNDLRTHDNPLLSLDTLPKGLTHLLPVYVFDERMIELSGLPSYPKPAAPARTRLCGFWRTGSYRARFVAEAVFDLRDQLRKRHSDLAIRYGLPEVVADNIVAKLQSDGDEVLSIVMQKEICREEVTMEQRLEKRMQGRSVPVQWFHTKPLIAPEDLPFAADEVPNVYTTFRKQVEGLKEKMWRPCLPVADKLPPFPGVPKTDDYSGAEDMSLPKIIEALYEPLKVEFPDAPIEGFDKRSAHAFTGGETTALSRLEHYFSNARPDGRAPPAARYKTTRNGMLGADYSTKMSAYLAIGCLSPRRMMQALEEHEKAFGGSKDSYWIQFELLWRDYFLYAALKFDNLLFHLEGFESATDSKAAAAKSNDWKWWQDGQRTQPRDLQAWMDGKTGVPLIDANMSELRATGFMSNRGRQNVASFLSKDLGYDWRIGAEFFESTLVDYDPTSNYGNWQYNSGVGNDPRAHRQFNPIKQARDYDAKGEYIVTWLPQLAPYSIDQRHVPWLLTSAQREQHQLTDDKFPQRPIIEQSTWKAHYKRNQSNRSKNRGRPRGLGPKSQREGRAHD